MTATREYLEHLRAGEPFAVERFYRDHAQQVLGWAIRLGGPRLDPDDTAQEVFSIALRKLHTFRGESALSTWLFVITRNVIANARRRAAFRRLVGLDDGMDTLPHDGELADEQLERMRRRRLVQRALERMGTQQREVLVLMDLEGRTAPEVAEMLGIPPGTAYSRLHYARRAFREALRREGVSAPDDSAVAAAGGGR